MLWLIFLYLQALHILEQNLGHPLHTNDWLELASTLGSVLSDIRHLDSLNHILW